MVLGDFSREESLKKETHSISHSSLRFKVLLSVGSQCWLIIKTQNEYYMIQKSPSLVLTQIN